MRARWHMVGRWVGVSEFLAGSEFLEDVNQCNRQVIHMPLYSACLVCIRFSEPLLPSEYGEDVHLVVYFVSISLMISSNLSVQEVNLFLLWFSQLICCNKAGALRFRSRVTDSSRSRGKQRRGVISWRLERDARIPCRSYRSWRSMRTATAFVYPPGTTHGRHARNRQNRKVERMHGRQMPPRTRTRWFGDRDASHQHDARLLAEESSEEEWVSTRWRSCAYALHAER